MPDMIRDGTGQGYLAKVTSENKLRTYSTNEYEVSFESETNERAYTWTTKYNVTAGDTVLWLRNNSSTLNLIIDLIILANDAITQVVIFSPENTTPSGTTVTGTNLNFGSTLAADATAYSNETGCSQANIIANASLSANVTALLPVNGAFILGYKNEIAIDFVVGSTSIGMATIRGYYHEVI